MSEVATGLGCDSGASARPAHTLIGSNAHKTNESKGEEEAGRGQRKEEGRRRTGRSGRTDWASGNLTKKNKFLLQDDKRPRC